MSNSNLEEDRCITCAYFEERSGFCRVNPPQPITIKDSQGRSCVTSVYPVIKKPMIDWCSMWDPLS